MNKCVLINLPAVVVPFVFTSVCMFDRNRLMFRCSINSLPLDSAAGSSRSQQGSEKETCLTNMTCDPDRG